MLDKQLAEELKSLHLPEDKWDTYIGRTMCTTDFYEGQSDWHREPTLPREGALHGSSTSQGTHLSPDMCQDPRSETRPDMQISEISLLGQYLFGK